MNERLDIDRIAFIGRTFDEYRDIFMLDEDILRRGPVLDCPAGAASFAAEAHRSGINITACDILLDFHKASLKELIRVASGEVRIYPLSGLDARPYPYMDDVLSFLPGEGVKPEIVDVPFEFQKGANKMLKLRKDAK